MRILKHIGKEFRTAKTSSEKEKEKKNVKIKKFHTSWIALTEQEMEKKN